MKKILFCIALLIVPSIAKAQSNPIVVGPLASLAWDIATDPTTAQGWTYNITIDVQSTKVLTGVSCLASVPATTPVTSTCSVPLVPQIGLGSHTITMTSQSGTAVSLPSTPYAYTALLIIVPANVRIK
jgi:hypothetical protein